MIHISHIVKKWREGVTEDFAPNNEDGNSGKIFERQARVLLKKVSTHYDNERKESKKKFSDLLSQLAEEKEQKVEKKDKKVAPAVPTSYTESDVVNLVRKDNENKGDNWDEELDSFTQGLFEELPASVEQPKAQSSRSVDNSEVEQSVAAAAPKAQKPERQARSSSPRQAPQNEEETVDPSDDPWNMDEPLNIESVIKSMKTNDKQGKPMDRSHKRRRDSGSRRKGGGDKKGTRHKWV